MDWSRTAEYRPPTRAWVLLRVVSVAVSFVLLLSSYYGIKFTQSSINAERGLGTASLAVVYASVLFSSILLANLIVDAFGPKQCLALSMIGYVSYVSLNAYPSFFTLIPASVVVGLCSAPLWASLAKYNMQLAALYSAATGKAVEASSSIIFGLFYAISNTSYVWGNLISFLALRDDGQPSNSTVGGSGGMYNASVEVQEMRCGNQFCPADVKSGSKIVRPPEERIYTMVGCFLAFSTAAVLIVVFLVPVIRTAEADDPEKKTAAAAATAGAKKVPQQAPVTLTAKLSRTARQIVKPRQLLMTPQLINVGLSQSFAQGEFTQAFVACSQGVAYVGIVMMCYGGSQIVSSLVFGKLAEVTSKQVCVYAATAAQLTLALFLLFWTVDTAVAPLFVCSIVCGMVDAVWNSQLLALQGELYPNDQVAAFATYKVWESLGYIVGFAYSTALCTRHKLTVMVCLLAVSAGCFTVHNWLRHRESHSSVGSVKDAEDEGDVQELA